MAVFSWVKEVSFVNAGAWPGNNVNNANSNEYGAYYCGLMLG
jgi:hypothetical protein